MFTKCYTIGILDLGTIETIAIQNNNNNNNI